MATLDKQPIRDLVSGFSIETTVKEAQRIPQFGDLVRAGTQIYIAHVPGTEPAETIALAGRLRQQGMEPVPHIVARRIESAKALDDLLGRFVNEAGVKQVLVVAGDIEQPTGELSSALQILDLGLLEKHGIRKLGVAGHPEGHRAVNDGTLKEALARKNAYAQKTGADVYVVTQFVFTPDPIVAWEESASEVNRLPYIAGVPGLATMKTLLKYAIDCGVGPSLHALSKHAANLTKLLTVATPDELLVGLAKYKSRQPQTRLAGVHFFPFGGLKRTAEWLNKIVDGEFELTDNESGLKVA
jgi:methylenetetrahydrofolate reductase (NADPH)